MTEPQATVLIPTRNRATSLRRVLAGLETQDCGGAAFEVVVVCDGLSDPAKLALESSTFGFGLRVAEQDHKGPGAARNLGISLARSGLVIFLDDDVIPSPGFVSAHIRAHRDADNLAVAGPLLSPAGWGSPWTRFERDSLEHQYWAMAAGRWVMSPRQFYTGNASVRRSHLQAVGGFDETFSRAEDVELAFRLRSAGVGFAFAADAQVTHLAKRSYGAWLRAARQYGRSDAVMARAKGRSDLIDAVVDEFHGRHPLTQFAVLWSLRHPTTASLMTWMARPLASAALVTGRERLAVGICSGAFNLRYWAGLADELGSRSRVVSLLTSNRHAGRAAGANDAGPAALKASAIICTRNRQEQCLEGISSILTAAPAWCEVLVVDQSDEEGMGGALLTLPDGKRVRYLRTASRGLSAARNIAAGEATGEYLLFTDDDCRVAADWVEAWCAAFDSHPHAALGFGRVDPAGDAPDGDYTPEFPGDDASYGPELFLRGEGGVGLGANMALRRQAWKDLGGFDEQLGVGAVFRAAEDLDMAYRVARSGYRILQLSAPRVTHYGGRGGHGASQLVRGYLLGVGAMYAKHLRCGDMFVVRLMGRDLAHYSAAIARRLLLRKSPWGVGKVLFMLKGAQQGAFKPLDRRHRLYRSHVKHA
jgi:GT2 family glycosyltransferase